MRASLPILVIPVLILLLLSACETDRALKRRASAACAGELNFGYGELDKAAAARCDAMMVAMIEGLAVIGKQRAAGLVCIPSNFDLAGYKKRILDGLGDETVDFESLERDYWTNLEVFGSADAECGWQPQEVTGSYQAHCRWGELLYDGGDDSKSRFEELAKASGRAADRETFLFAADSLMRCEGYFKGAVWAGRMAAEIYQVPIFCVPGTSEPLLNQDLELSDERLQRLVAKLDGEPEGSDGPAADFFYAFLSEELRCPTPTS